MMTNNALSIAGNEQPLMIKTEGLPGLTSEDLKIIEGRKLAILNFIRDTLRELKALGRLRQVDVTLAAPGSETCQTKKEGDGRWSCQR